MPGFAWRKERSRSCRERGSIRWSCWTAARGWCSSRGVRSRTSLLIWGFRRRRCASTCARSRRTRAPRRTCRRARSARRSRELRRENFELRRANEILKAASRVFRGRARSTPSEVSRVHRRASRRFGVEPICRALGVSASAYYQRATGQRSARAVEDERLLDRIRELHAANYYAYGYRRMWKALLRAGEQVGRGRVSG